MVHKKDSISAEELNKSIIKGIQEKKGSDIVVLNLTDIGNAIADYFVLCTGNSDTQIDAITESIEKEVYLSTHEDPWHKEGFQNKEWILIDYVNVVVHIFRKDVRDFFALEELWGDAVAITIND